MTPQELRQLSQSQHWSEDFQRFDDNTLQDWISNYWDQQAQRFKSAKVDANGQQIQGRFEKVDDCPEGTQAFGSNQCLPVAEVQARVARQQGGGGGAMGAQPYTPPAPVTVGKPGELTYTGNPLTDALLYQFNTQKSLSTGASNFGGYQDQDKNSLQGRLLHGGGLIWGGGGQGAPPGGGSPLGTVTPEQQQQDQHWAQHAAGQAAREPQGGEVPSTPPPFQQPAMTGYAPTMNSPLATSLMQLPGMEKKRQMQPAGLQGALYGTAGL